jgi:hypothetical protein
MVQIDDKLISLDIFERHFICDVSKCKGACCVEGDSGAPLEDNETEILESVFPLIKDRLSKEALQVISEKGVWEVDSDGDKVTPIINGRECVYTTFTDDGVCKCVIEEAFNEGLINFKKPISCHLYPIRVTRYADFEALNYHQWPICGAARALGAQVGMPVFRFLKEALIRKYGQAFYDEMEEADKLLKNNDSKDGR